MTKKAGVPPTGDRGIPTAPPAPPAWRHYLWIIALAIFLVLLFKLPTTHTSSVSLNYSQFLHDVSIHKVKTVTIDTSGSASGTLTNGGQYTTAFPPQAGQSLLDKLSAAGVQITANTNSTSFGSEILSWVILLLPFLILGYLWWRLSKGAAGRMQGALGVGRSKAKVFDEERPKTTFADVAGYEGAKFEIREVVDFLRNPERYARAGAMAPRGVLMVGPPGTGKTLLARAVAGEADVPFFSVTGSSFVEMFVGVGAARVRDLFQEARKRAPAIIFVDEIDAIGQRRGGPERWSRTTSASRLSTSSSPRWTASIRPPASSSSPRPTDPRCSTRRCYARAGSIVRSSSRCRPCLSGVPSWMSTAGANGSTARCDLDVVARGTPGFSGADLGQPRERGGHRRGARRPRGARRRRLRRGS